MRDLRYTEHGLVKSVSGCIVTVVNFQNCFLGQLVKFGYGSEGIIMGFDEKGAQVLIVKEHEPITPGREVIATLEPFNMSVGAGTIGRIIDPIGEPLDGLGPVKFDGVIPYFNDAPAIMDRENLSRTLETGLKLVDTMLPIGKGQRMLILGDKMVGKTTVLTDVMLNQKDTGVICIYCAIGKTRSALARVISLLKESDCFKYSIVLAATAASSPGLQYLAPYAACSVAEYFMYQGKDVFVGFDDFTKHAWAYRELSLMMQVPPGRDSYPGDIFYLHSRMIERAAQLDKKHGGGSITFMPIVELLEGDLTAYVPTNLVSMTDGQVYLSLPLFNEGFRPAVDVGLSVSRVGSRVQWKATRTVSKSLRLEFIQFKELLRVSKLQTGGQSEEMREKLGSGKILQTLLTQPANSPVSQEEQVMIFYAKDQGMLKELNKDQTSAFQSGLRDFVLKQDPGLFRLIRAERNITDEIAQRITQMVQAYLTALLAKGPDEAEFDVEVG